MGSRIDSDKLSIIISEIQKRLEDLKTRCTSDPDNAKEILSDALVQLQATSQQLSSIGAAVVGQDITECKKEEEALNESEEKFRASFENSMDAILLTSPDDGKIEAANPAACQMFGMTEEEIIRASRSGIVDTNDPRIEGAIEERARTQRFRGEINHKRKDGTIFPAEVSTALFTDKNGKVKTTMIIRDITERKLMEEKMTLAKLRAEEIARSAERQFREMEAAFSSIADGVVVYDKSANITYMNKAAKRISGLAENDFTRPFAERIKSIVSPNGIPFRYEELPFNRALKGEIVKDFEMVADNGAGMKFTVLASAATIYDDNGEIVGVVSTMKDITERKRTEEALKDSEERFRSVLDNARDVIARINLQTGRYDYVSPFAGAAVGYSADEFLAMDKNDISAIIHPDDLPILQAAMARSEDIGKAEAEYRQRTKNGEYIWVSSHMSVTKDASGQPLFRTNSLRDITKRKRMEEALRESEQKFKAIADTSQVAITLYQDGHVIYANDASEAIFGYSLDERRQMKLSDLMHPDYREKAEKRMKVLQKGGPYHSLNEYKIIRKDGKERWVLSSGSKITCNGRAAVIITSVDITDRKEAELKLVEAIKKIEQNQLILDAVIQQMPAGVIITDASGSTAKNNEAMDTIWKREMLPTENIESHGYRAFHPDGSEYLPDEWPLTRALRRGEVTIGEEMSILRGDGTKGTLNVSSTPIRNSNGKIIAGVVVDVDITKQKQMENELRRAKDELEQRVQERTAELEEANKALCSSEQRLVLAQKAGGVGVYDWNVVTGEVIWTPELERVYGMPAPANAKERQKAWLSCIHPEDLQQALEIKKQWLESTQNVLEGEYRIIRPDGQERWITGSHLVIRDSDNRPLRVIGTQIDFTERKMIENEMRKAKETAEVAAEAKAAFMANMSHELRTPMNYIVGMTSLLLDEPLTPELRDYIETIKKGSDEMIALINNILSFSEVEKGSVPNLL